MNYRLFFLECRERKISFDDALFLFRVRAPFVGLPQGETG
jgi:hypothetical protein